MAIQIPNAGTGNGQTGDNEYVLWQKTINNFSDQTNAASRLVGAGIGQIPLASQTREAAYKSKPNHGDVLDCDYLPVGSWFKVSSDGTNTQNAPSTQFGESYWTLKCFEQVNGNLIQKAYGMREPIEVSRVRFDGVWTPWVASATNKIYYNSTTAANPNVAVDSTGKLMRSTSSEKYKDILGDLILTDELYKQALQVRPIVYRSLAEADPENWHYLSFSAEEIGSYDPAFTFWQTHETDPETGKQVLLAEKQAEGINLNAITAMLHATNIKQDKLIKALEARIVALEPKKGT